MSSTLMAVKSKEASANVSPPAREVFAAALRKRRKELGLSQEVLADLAEVHRTYVGQIERGEKNVSIDSMEKLAGALGVPLWRLLQGER